jgi:hypothetical protein
MIPRGVEIFVGLEPIDLRWSFDRLALAVLLLSFRGARLVSMAFTMQSSAVTSAALGRRLHPPARPRSSSLDTKPTCCAPKTRRP